MTNRVANVLGVAALVAQVVVVGCSSSSGSSGTGGSTGTGGAGGAAGAGAGGAGGAPMMIGAMCASTVKNKGTCTTDAPCWNTCGPNKSGFKNCTCASLSWACPTCAYDPAGDYSCYKLPATVPACPAVPANAGMLPQSGTACTLAPCTPCGSATAASYLDSTGAMKIGYCVCATTTDTDGGTVSKYSCASTTEWAPQ